MDLFASNFLSCDDQVCLLLHLGALFFGKTGFLQKGYQFENTWILLVSSIFKELSHTFFFFLHFKSGCPRV